MGTSTSLTVTNSGGGAHEVRTARLLLALLYAAAVSSALELAFLLCDDWTRLKCTTAVHLCSY